MLARKPHDLQTVAIMLKNRDTALLFYDVCIMYWMKGEYIVCLHAIAQFLSNNVYEHVSNTDLSI